MTLRLNRQEAREKESEEGKEGERGGRRKEKKEGRKEERQGKEKGGRGEGRQGSRSIAVSLIFYFCCSAAAYLQSRYITQFHRVSSAVPNCVIANYSYILCSVCTTKGRLECILLFSESYYCRHVYYVQKMAF